MVYEGIVYHPECFKDKNNAMDTSLDTSADTGLETAAAVAENEIVPKEEQIAKEEPKSQEDENVVATVEAENVKEESMELSEAETGSVPIKEEIDALQETDVHDNANVEEMELKNEADEEVKPEEEKTVEDKEEDRSANTSLVSDDNMLLAAPVVTQPKVVTKWRRDRDWSLSSVLFYCMQKYILGHHPLLLRGISRINDSSALMAWLLKLNRPVIIQRS